MSMRGSGSPGRPGARRPAPRSSGTARPRPADALPRESSVACPPRSSTTFGSYATAPTQIVPAHAVSSQTLCATSHIRQMRSYRAPASRTVRNTLALRTAAFPRRRLADELAQHVAGRRHDGARMRIAEQTLDVEVLGERCAAAGPHRRRRDGDRGVARCGLASRARAASSSPADARDDRQDRRGAPRAHRCRSASSQAARASVGRLSPRLCPRCSKRAPLRCVAVPATAARQSPSATAVAPRLNSGSTTSSIALKAGAVVGELKLRRDLAVLERHRRGGVGTQPETIPGTSDR